VILGIVIGLGGYKAYDYFGRKTTLPTLTEETVGGTQEVSSGQSNDTGSELLAKGNFSQKGTLIGQEDGWVLMWDEPGRLALNVKLKFTDQSICLLGDEEKDCALLNMGPESYEYVSVEGDKTDNEVIVIKLEESKLP